MGLHRQFGMSGDKPLIAENRYPRDGMHIL